MIASLCGDRQQDTLQLAGRVQAIHTFEVDLNRAEVGFVPARLELCPRERGLSLGVPADIDAAAVDVVGNVLQPGIVAQDQREVPEGVLDLAVLVDVQSILPVRVSLALSTFLEISFLDGCFFSDLRLTRGYYITV